VLQLGSYGTKAPFSYTCSCTKSGVLTQSQRTGMEINWKNPQLRCGEQSDYFRSLKKWLRPPLSGPTFFTFQKVLGDQRCSFSTKSAYLLSCGCTVFSAFPVTSYVFIRLPTMAVTSLEHHGEEKNFLEGPKFLKLCPIKPVTSLGHQIGQRIFWEGPKFFKICPVVLNYV